MGENSQKALSEISATNTDTRHINKIMKKSNLRNARMVIPTLILAFLALILFVILYSRGDGQYVQGLKIGYKLTIEVLPMLIFAFLIAGFIQILVPQQLISKWVGNESGIRGVLIGTLAGGLTPGGPFVSMPIVAGMLNSGASIGTMVAFITSWSLWSFARLPTEIGILGFRFALIRFASVFFFPPIAGFIASMIVKIFRVRCMKIL